MGKLPAKSRLAKNLAEIRLARGLTQADLADRIGADPQTISKWECERVTPSLCTLDALAGALKCDVADLLHR